MKDPEHSHIEKHRRQRKKIQQLLESIDEKANAFFNTERKEKALKC